MFNAESNNSEKININFSLRQVEEEIKKMGSPVSPKFSKCSSRFRKNILNIIKSTEIIESLNEEEIEEVDSFRRKISKIKSLNILHNSDFSNDENTNNERNNNMEEQKKFEKTKYNNINTLFESYKFNISENIESENLIEENNDSLEENMEENSCNRKENARLSLKEEINEFENGEDICFRDYVETDF